MNNPNFTADELNKMMSADAQQEDQQLDESVSEETEQQLDEAVAFRKKPGTEEPAKKQGNAEQHKNAALWHSNRAHEHDEKMNKLKAAGKDRVYPKAGDDKDGWGNVWSRSEAEGHAGWESPEYSSARFKKTLHRNLAKDHRAAARDIENPDKKLVKDAKEIAKHKERLVRHTKEAKAAQKELAAHLLSLHAKITSGRGIENGHNYDSPWSKAERLGDKHAYHMREVEKATKALKGLGVGK